jgi:hypothetical protein
MALTPERYSRVDAELQRIKHFLVTLAEEIETTAPATDKRGFSWMAAIQADSAMVNLRNKLKDDQEKQRIRDELRWRRKKPGLSRSGRKAPSYSALPWWDGCRSRKEHILFYSPRYCRSVVE